MPYMVPEAEAAHEVPHPITDLSQPVPSGTVIEYDLNWNAFSQYHTYALQKHLKWVLSWSYRDIKKRDSDYLSTRIRVQLGILDKKKNKDSERKKLVEKCDSIYCQELE